jgi:glyoxylase-like metal-dependent hydrolase (beta-lactamase superfamily II)
MIYLIDLGELVLIDCGAGVGTGRLADNIRTLGYEPATLNTLVLTHGHVDHIGGGNWVKSIAPHCRVVAHEGDLDAIETGNEELTAARWYNLELEGLEVDLVVDETPHTLDFPQGSLALHHTPGHTPGSMVALMDSKEGHRVLFGQDIHGPFSESFRSDIEAWKTSMKSLIDQEADILCEGHYGVFRGREKIRQFIEQQLDLHT